MLAEYGFCFRFPCPWCQGERFRIKRPGLLVLVKCLECGAVQTCFYGEFRPQCISEGVHEEVPQTSEATLGRQSCPAKKKRPELPLMKNLERISSMPPVSVAAPRSGSSSTHPTTTSTEPTVSPAATTGHSRPRLEDRLRATRSGHEP